jgi:hypothetical protein
MHIDKVIELLQAAKASTPGTSKSAPARSKTAKRKPSAYSKKYSKAFKSIAPKHKKKNGSWKKDGYKKAVKAAHAKAKRMK